MSFALRTVLGNAVGIVLAVAAMAIFNPKGDLLVTIAIGAVLLLVMSSLLGFLANSAFKPLAGIAVALEKAAGGDLSVRVVSSGSGEFRRLGTAFNTMMDDMNKAMRQFFSVAELVRDSVGMVSATTNSMVAAAEDVAMQAGTIATASEEMSATSGDIARNCLYAAENAQKATEQTHGGAQMVQSSAAKAEPRSGRIGA